MRSVVKKYIKPFLQKINVYDIIYKIYSISKNILVDIKNIILKKFTKNAPILTYHRITNTSEDPLKLCVPPKTFEQHLKFLKDNYNVIPLSELSEKITRKTLCGNEAAITFDDGYVDNLTNALPLLKKYELPATIFVTTSQIGEQASFEWDIKYTEEDRACFLSCNEIKEISNNPLIEIGAHTHTHKRLSDLTYDEQKKDILLNKEILEDITNDNIKLLAYPFGGKLDFDKNSKKVASEIGFSFAFSNTSILSSKYSSRFSVPRINIREDNFFKIFKK